MSSKQLMLKNARVNCINLVRLSRMLPTHIIEKSKDLVVPEIYNLIVRLWPQS